MLLVKHKLNNIEVLIYNALINSCINDDKLVSVDNVFIQDNKMKDEIKNPENCAECTIKIIGNLLCHLSIKNRENNSSV